MRKAYRDKLDGLIGEGFWRANMQQWSTEELELQAALEESSKPRSEQKIVEVEKILKLAQNSNSMFFTLDYVERAKLLKRVLSNCNHRGPKSFPFISKAPSI